MANRVDNLFTEEDFESAIHACFRRCPMRKFFFSLLFLFSFASVYAGNDYCFGQSNPGLYITADCSVSPSIAGCVSPISGHFFYGDEDIFIDTPSPLKFSRSYDSGHAFQSAFGFSIGGPFPSCIDHYRRDHESGAKIFRMIMDYTREGASVPFESNGFSSKDGEVHQRWFKYDHDNYDNVGGSRYFGGQFGGRVDPANVKVKFRHWEVEGADGRQQREWTVFLGNGGQRIYFDHYPSGHDGLLHHEILPNGNKRFYNYVQGTDRPDRVWTTNASGTKLINQLDFDYRFLRTNETEYEVIGSNGQTFTGQQKICTASFNVKRHTGSGNTKEIAVNQGVSILMSAQRSNQPDIVYERSENDHPRIKRIERPDGRYLAISYYGGDEKARVRYLKAPVGADDSEIRTHEIHYSKEYFAKKKKTFLVWISVYDAYGMKTKYRLGNLSTLLDSFREFDANEELYRRTEFYDGGLFAGVGYLNSEGKCYRTFWLNYNEENNVKEKVFYGNLTGNSQEGSHFKDNESYTNYYEYGENNLLTREDDGFGKVVLYSYKPGTDLLIKQLTEEHGHITKRVFNAYDDCAGLIESIEDDGSSEDPSNLTDVTVQRIRRITPSEDLLTFGKPLEIFEAYYDPGRFHEKDLTDKIC